MRLTRRPPAAFALVWLPLLLGAAVLPPAAAAQTDAGPTWSVVPLVGFGVLRRNGGWDSAGMEAGVDIEHANTRWRGYGSAALRGVGVSCSHGGCLDGGPAAAIGGARSVGKLWIGGGTGIVKHAGHWRWLPYGRLSLDAAPFRLDMRAERSPVAGSSIHLPILIGFPISMFPR